MKSAIYFCVSFIITGTVCHRYSRDISGKHSLPSKTVSYSKENNGIEGYKFAFDIGTEGRKEIAKFNNSIWTINGRVMWSSPDGQTKKFHYIADHNGYRLIPMSPDDPPDPIAPDEPPMPIVLVMKRTATNPDDPSYYFSYKTDDQERTESGMLENGIWTVRGEVKWLSSGGKEHSFKFIADDKGYRITSQKII